MCFCRYSKCLQRVLQRSAGHADSELRRLGLTPESYGAHSSRKGSATYASSGSTACPSNTAISLRAGWAMVGIEGTYRRWDAAGDQHVGRCCACLPVTAPAFMILPPFFSRFNEDGTPRAGINAKIQQAVRRAFGAGLPDGLMQIAEHALASVLHNFTWLQQTLPSQHRLFSNLFIIDSTELAEMRRLVMCVMPNSAAAIREGKGTTVTGKCKHIVASEPHHVHCDIEVHTILIVMCVCSSRCLLWHGA
jgi:hypothetical protein